MTVPGSITAAPRISMLIALLLVSGCFHQWLVEARLGMGATSLTEANFHDFLSKNEKALVDFFDPNDPNWYMGQSELEAAVRLARDDGSRVPFGKVDAIKNGALARKYIPDGRYPQLMWFVHGEPTQYHRTLRNAASIATFVLALDRDTMVAVANEEEARNFVPAIFAQVKKASPIYRILEVVASKHMDTVAFTFVNGASNDIAWLGSETPPVPYTGEHSAPALERWVRTNLVKSEPIPEDKELMEDEGSQVVVGHTFEQMVLRPDKDVALLVYAPWCGHCKRFDPIWNTFAQGAKHVAHLVVAKIDGSRNDSPLPETFEWKSYPKVFYVRAGEKQPEVFEGIHTLDSLMSFMRQHSTKPIALEKASRVADLENVFDL